MCIEGEMNVAGLFITFEGGEGAGKTTVLQAISEQLLNKGYDIVTTREPGGIRIAERIRNIILTPEHEEMDGRTEALLYAAARRQHLVEKILPALDENKIVLCDRFIDSSLAYQGYARGLGIEDVWQMNQFAIQDAMPDLTLFFDIEPEAGLKRIAANKDRERNRLDLEVLSFHQKVYEAYHLLVKKFPERIKVIQANQPLQRVEEETMSQIIAFLKNKSFY